MPGRLQKVAALAAAASAFACPSFAHEPNGPGAPEGAVDPAPSPKIVEIGFRRHLPFGIESKVSMFRAASDFDVLRTGENAITEFSRPTVREGVQATARYEPASWVAVDLRAAALHARFADNGAGYIPGAAERSASASATIRMPGRWRASLMASYLGKRAGTGEDTSLRASTFVSAGLTHDVSRTARLSLEVPNLFGQRVRDVDYFWASRASGAFGAGDAYLFNPAQPRGLRLRLRTTF